MLNVIRRATTLKTTQSQTTLARSRLPTQVRNGSLYVGNIPWEATEQEVAEIFAPYGPVKNVRLVVDRDTGRARGFGFVELADEDMESAIQNLNGVILNGRSLRINKSMGRNPPQTDED